jgi:glycosyltransferase involved in cell wall biosynthesis
MMRDKKLKIGYIMQADAVDMSSVSGPQLHVKAVFEGFKKNGHCVRMVAIQRGEILQTDNLVDWKPCEYGFSESPIFHLVESALRFIQGRLRLPFFRLFDSYRFSDACEKSFKGFDILYERDSTMSYGGLMAARKLGIPLVLEVNGDLVEEWNQLGIQWSRIQENIVHFITGQEYRRATHVIAVGETIRQRLIDRWHLSPSHVSVVTNGADVNMFLESEVDPNTRGQFLLDNGPLIIFVGGFQPWHGIELIIEAFRKISVTNHTTQLVLVGDGPLRLELQNKAQSLVVENKVVFTGRVNHADIGKLLRLADIAIIYHRGISAEIVETPLKLFEYMAAGKAIVAPAVPNMRRILTDRVNALLVPPDSPEALAEACIELLEDQKLRTDLGTAARKEAVEKHSWDRAVRELETILYNILEPTPNGTYKVGNIPG